mmetsp:Transcript_120203/g.256533  ORF Transcript_120203/g.256533 Transcript_120203/m.256533 type:complete len:389 (-) Transcript_120203:134-1300(-)
MRCFPADLDARNLAHRTKVHRQPLLIFIHRCPSSCGISVHGQRRGTLGRLFGGGQGGAPEGEVPFRAPPRADLASERLLKFGKALAKGLAGAAAFKDALLEKGPAWVAIAPIELVLGPLLLLLVAGVLECRLRGTDELALWKRRSHRWPLHLIALLNEALKRHLQGSAIWRPFNRKFVIEDKDRHLRDAHGLVSLDLAHDFVHPLLAVQHLFRALDSRLFSTSKQDGSIAEAKVILMVGGVDRLNHLILDTLLASQEDETLRIERVADVPTSIGQLETIFLPFVLQPAEALSHGLLIRLRIPLCTQLFEESLLISAFRMQSRKVRVQLKWLESYLKVSFVSELAHLLFNTALCRPRPVSVRVRDDIHCDLFLAGRRWGRSNSWVSRWC